MHNLSKKQAKLNLVLYWLGYTFVFPLIASLFLTFLPESLSVSLKPLFEALIYGLTFSVIVLGSYRLLKNEFALFIKRIKSIFSFVIQYQATMYLLNFVINLAILLFTGNLESNNQMQIIEQLRTHLVSTVFLSCIFAPFVEELVFRASIYRLCYQKNSKLCVLLASCTFGLLHVLTSVISGDWADCLYFFSYSAMGFCLCQCYEKSKTIYGSILLHMLNNTISILMLLGI